MAEDNQAVVYYRREKRSWRRFWPGLVILTAIGLLALGFGIWRFNQARQKEAAAEFTRTIQTADKLAANRQYDAEIALLQNYVHKTSNRQYLYAAKSRLGVAFYNKGDWGNAVSWLTQAQALGGPGSEGLWLNIAIAAEKSGDKTRAIEAYKQVIILYQKQGSASSLDDVARFQAKVTALGGKP